MHIRWALSGLDTNTICSVSGPSSWTERDHAVQKSREFGKKLQNEEYKNDCRVDVLAYPVMLQSFLCSL